MCFHSAGLVHSITQLGVNVYVQLLMLESLPAGGTSRAHCAAVLPSAVAGNV